MRSPNSKLARLLLLAAVAGFVVTCTDSPFTSPPNFDGPMFAILDGGHFGGNGDVFFLEPLADFDATNPNFGDRLPNPYLAPIARVCALNATEQPPNPTVLGCIPFGEPGYQQDFTLDPDRMYRIEIFLGNFSLEAYRDVDPDDGPSVASCADEPFCQFNSGGSGGVPIKVIIETGAACIAAGADPDVCATATLSAGGTLVLQQDVNTTVGVAAVDEVTGGGSATVSMQLCTDLRDREFDFEGRVDLPTFGDCIEIDNLDNPLEVFGTVTQCDAFNEATGAGGLSDAAAGRMTVHRFSAGDQWSTVALSHSEDVDVCATEAAPQGQAFEFSTLQKVVRLARRTTAAVGDQVLALVAPPVWACHRGGCSSYGGFRSSYQVAQPAWMEFGVNPGSLDVGSGWWDLGTYDAGTVVTAKVKAWDSGECDKVVDPDCVSNPEAVNNVRLTVSVTAGNALVSGDGVNFSIEATIQTASDPDDGAGIGTFQVQVEGGASTIEVSGIGVGTDGNVFAPSINHTISDPYDPDEDEVQLGSGELTFTAVGAVPLEFRPPPGDITMEEDGFATLTEFQVCTVGGAVEGIPINDIKAVTNNGSWVELRLDGGEFPDGDQTIQTGPDGCYTFGGEDGPELRINKTGAYRLVVNPVFNDRDKVIDGDGQSIKFNVRPLNKK
jgi:hypothetical protein